MKIVGQLNIINGLNTTGTTVMQGAGDTSSTNTLLLQDSGGTTTMVVEDGGNVGIGTAAPTAKLHVKTSTAGPLNNAFLVQNNLVGGDLLSIKEDGATTIYNRLGVGAIPQSNATSYLLSLSGDFYGKRIIADNLTTNGFGLHTRSTSATNNTAIFGQSTTSGSGVEATGVWGQSLGTNGTNHTGVVGVGLNGSSFTFGVEGRINSGASVLSSNRTVAVSGINSSSNSNNNYAGYFRANVSGAAVNSIGGYFRATGGVNNYAIVTPADGGNIGFGTLTPTARLHVDGSLRLSNLTTTPAAGYVLQSVDADGNADWANVNTLISGGTDGNGVYDGSGIIPTSTVASLTDTFKFSGGSVTIQGVGSGSAILGNISGIAASGAIGLNGSLALSDFTIAGGNGNDDVYINRPLITDVIRFRYAGGTDQMILTNTSLNTISKIKAGASTGLADSLSQIYSESQVNGTNSYSFEGQDTTPFAAGVGGGILFSGRINATTGVSGFAAIQGVKSNSTADDSLGELIFRAGTQGVDELMRLNNDGLGVGINTPTAKLHVQGNGDTSSTDTFILQDSGGTTTMVVEDGGNVGIGTAAPTAKLHVDGSLRIDTATPSAIGEVWTATDVLGNGEWAGSDGNGIFDAANNDATLSSNFGFRVADTLTIKSTTGLDLVSFNTTQGLLVGNTTGSSSNLIVDTNNGAPLWIKRQGADMLKVTYNGSNPTLRMYSSGVQRVNINAESFAGDTYFNHLGNTGFGLNNPTAKLHVDGSVRLSNLTTTPAAGYVLQSTDANGNTDWVDVNTLVTGGTGGGGVLTDTGTVISFSAQTIYNKYNTAVSGNTTDDLTDAALGVVQKYYHQSSVAPTFPAGWVLMGDGVYFTDELNVIYAEWVDGTRVEYWIVQEQ